MAKFVFDLKYVHHGALPVWATVPYMFRICIRLSLRQADFCVIWFGLNDFGYANRYIGEVEA
ncbi:hypothetical protein PAECIP111890_01699 [Paenibacillus sp. JJ-223]|nr:hypothetical protein PAECIP111890_01699 [Paenibacillus sp. JJ-223]